jgi:hypothetical protein
MLQSPKQTEVAAQMQATNREAIAKEASALDKTPEQTTAARDSQGHTPSSDTHQHSTKLWPADAAHLYRFVMKDVIVKVGSTWKILL